MRPSLCIRRFLGGIGGSLAGEACKRGAPPPPAGALRAVALEHRGATLGQWSLLSYERLTSTASRVGTSTLGGAALGQSRQPGGARARSLCVVARAQCVCARAWTPMEPFISSANCAAAATAAAAAAAGEQRKRKAVTLMVAGQAVVRRRDIRPRCPFPCSFSLPPLLFTAGGCCSSLTTAPIRRVALLRSLLN